MKEGACDSPTRPTFSLLFFASQQAAYQQGKFDLFRESALFADRHGFEAVWIPERHFHEFGGIFPNPALPAVILAEHTQNIRIRAGSVVLPLHSPIRVAEEWAVVDNLSNGRVDIAFAIGWNPNDFVIAPDRFETRKQYTFENIDVFRRLWNGDTVEFRNGVDKMTPTQVYPLPLQQDLSIWLTCSGGKERFEEAGAKGYNILTALLFQKVDELAEKLTAYRRARAAHGHPGRGQVTLMLHTFVGPTEDDVRRIVREPFKKYLAASVDLWQTVGDRLEDLSPRKRDDLLEFAFERYYRKTALMGSPESCVKMVEAVAAAGADEIACLIDFGVPPQVTMEHMRYLDQLRQGKTQE